MGRGYRLFSANTQNSKYPRVTHNIDGMAAVQTRRNIRARTFSCDCYGENHLLIFRSRPRKVCRMLTAHRRLLYTPSTEKKISHMRFAYACIMRINRFTFDPHLFAPIECSRNESNISAPHSHRSASILIAHALPSLTQFVCARWSDLR